MLSFAQKRVLITGASSGIGAELARQLAAEKARVVLAARRADRLDEVAKECRALGGEAHVVTADVTQEADCKRMVEQTVAALGGLDLLIVNAGNSMWALFEDITDLSIFRKLMETNYLSAVYTTYYALPHLKASKGRIVAMSSLTGKTGVPTRTAYSASKHAMNGFFDSLRAELWKSGVTVTVVCPNFVKTEIRERAFAADGKPLRENPLGDERDSMTAEECARITLAGVRRGKREVIMTAAGKIGKYLKPFAPGLIDAIARKKTKVT
ncbi:MAG TPA: SDR family oxidoreductase [bacterium]|nr:SDR family oxidoreductase [bacterium]